MTMPRGERAILGLDVGGTKLAAGVLSWTGRGGRLVSWERTETTASEGPHAVLQRLATLGFRAIEAAGLEVHDLDAVGIGCGGPLDTGRGVVSPVNMPDWLDVPLADSMASAFGLPAWVDNDGNAGVLGEAVFGAARGAGDAVYLTISTGVGGGVITGGRVLRGASGNAGELGHICIVKDGRRCPCGGRGCLEAYASGTSIAARAREAIEAGDATIMLPLAGRTDLVTAETVVTGVRAGDSVAQRIWRETIEALAAGIASVINAFNPQIVVLGGGVARAGDLLFVPVRERVNAQALPELARGTRIVGTALGDRLGVYGAGAVALAELQDGRHGSAASAAKAVVETTSEEAGDNAPAPPASAGRAGGGHESRSLEAIEEHVDLARAVGKRLGGEIDEIADLLCAALGRGGRLIAFGNGGSAADAQHFVAELIGHYRRDRLALPAVALTGDASVVTAISNDYGYADVFARQVEALAGPDDVVFGISTSGNAANVVRGLLAARLRGAATVALTGGTGGSAARVAKYALVVPSRTTARIQEMHTLIVHLLSERVDEWAAGEEARGDADIIPIRPNLPPNFERSKLHSPTDDLADGDTWLRPRR